MHVSATSANCVFAPPIPPYLVVGFLRLALPASRHFDEVVWSGRV
ncbi:hypothetical protein AB0B11_28210 [Micromonospora tulbaghiae]